MNNALADEFNRTAAAAYAAFPRELERLVVFLTPADTPVYVAPAIAARLTGKTAEVKDAVQRAMDEMQAHHWNGLANRNYPLAGMTVNLIAQQNEPGRSAQYELFGIDHEIGHHILKNGHAAAGVSRQKAESAADAFAMLRHIQRFGADTDWAHNYAHDRAFCIILRKDTEHYTTKTVRRAVEVAVEKDISGLSLRETAQLAEAIANECATDDATLKKVCTAFNTAREALAYEAGSAETAVQLYIHSDTTIHLPICLATLAVMKNNLNDPDVLEAGREFLKHPAFQKVMKESAKTNIFWREAIDFIGSLEKTESAPKKLILPGTFRP